MSIGSVFTTMYCTLKAILWPVSLSDNKSLVAGDAKEARKGAFRVRTIQHVLDAGYQLLIEDDDGWLLVTSLAALVGGDDT